MVYRRFGSADAWRSIPPVSLLSRVWYNAEHRHSGIRFVTPDERHHGRENDVLANRVRVYERARRRHPNRWSRGTRNWTPAPAVFLNAKRDQETIEGALSRATS